MSERRNLIVVALGKKGAGKSSILRKYRAAFPRVVSYDPVLELKDAPGVVNVYDADDCKRTLARLVTERRTRWHVAACVDPDVFVSILRQLVPASMQHGRGFAQAVGGVCIEVPELDTIAPNHAGIDKVVADIFQRGRHYAVSVLGDTQAPAYVNRRCTSLSDVLLIFAQHEPRHVQYVRELTSEPIARVVRTLPRYWHVRYHPNHGLAEVVDDTGAVDRVLNASGVVLRGRHVQGDMFNS